MKTKLLLLVMSIMLFFVLPTTIFAEENYSIESSSTVNVNKSQSHTLMYNGQNAFVNFRTNGTYMLNSNQYKIWITNINLNTWVENVPSTWQFEIVNTQYNSQNRYVKVMIRYRLIEDQWDSLTNGWHYNSVEYSV